MLVFSDMLTFSYEKRKMTIPVITQAFKEKVSSFDFFQGKSPYNGILIWLEQVLRKNVYAELQLKRERAYLEKQNNLHS